MDVIRGDPNGPHLEPDSVNAIPIVCMPIMRCASLAPCWSTFGRRSVRRAGMIVEQITEARRDVSRDVQAKAHDVAPEYAVNEVHTAGFRVERLDSNFTVNPATRDINWIIVATPGNRLRGALRAAMAAAR